MIVGLILRLVVVAKVINPGRDKVAESSRFITLSVSPVFKSVIVGNW